MIDFTKRERQELREIADTVYEAEATQLLERLARSFDEWRSGVLLPSELLQTIHEFHRDESRELWSLYQGLREPNIVARGLALGLIFTVNVPPPLHEKLASLIELYRQ